jgi:ring-1,2-phenylacetyl-CoA epoxidase subunit PaaC
VIGRQFLFDAFHLPLLEQLVNSKDEMIAAVAAKSIKESRYHLRFSSSWMERLGDGTQESHQRMQKAIDDLYL